MSTYIQADRPLRVQTALGTDAFILAGVRGEEAISTPFVYQLELRSENEAVDGKSLVRTPATIALPGDKGTRHIHGSIRRFVQLGRAKQFTSYYAELVPEIWFFSLSSDCRIYQNKSVPEIVKQVCKDLGFSDIKDALTKTYSPREYCVQYRETHLDFISRLLEEEGIFYFFEHEENKHKLVLADGNSAAPISPSSPISVSSIPLMNQEVVLTVRKEFGAHTGHVDLKDYDHLQPQLNLLGTSAGPYPEKWFDYPGKFTTKEDGERLARQQLEAIESMGEVLRGETDARSLQAGMRFKLAGHYNDSVNGEYLIISLKARGSGAGTGEDRPDDKAKGKEEPPYLAEFTAIPFATRYVPEEKTPKPVIAGTQTAVVCGKSGEEIWVDSHGRIKVQFHWDRYGHNDENSSCWVRVASTWSGKAWGAIAIPRMGQEVVVEFLEGDPDRPLVTGSVYNADMVVPYTLPANHTQWGLRSRSTKQGGTENYNELLIEDLKDKEFISVHAEKDLKTEVEHDETRDVLNNRTTTIHKDDTRTVKEGKDTHTVEQGDQIVQVKQGKQSVTVDLGDQIIKLGQGNQKTTLEKGDQITELQMGNTKMTLDMGNQEITLQLGSRKVHLMVGNLETKLDLGAISYEALQGIELKSGPNSIKVDPMGVTIKGLMVQIEGQVQTSIKGLMTQVNGDAMLMAKGGITMIG